MEFYKLVRHQGVYQLEEELGQDGARLDNETLGQWAQLLFSCYQQQEQLPLQFRRYLTAYYTTGEMEYIALADAACLPEKPELDGFATTWLDGEEENRVWLGADGAIENRGLSGDQVKMILDLLLQAVRDGSHVVKPMNADMV